MEKLKHEAWKRLMDVKKRNGIKGFTITLSRAVKLNKKVAEIIDQLLIYQTTNPYYNTSAPMKLISLDQLLVEHDINLFKYVNGNEKK